MTILHDGVDGASETLTAHGALVHARSNLLFLVRRALVDAFGIGIPAVRADRATGPAHTLDILSRLFLGREPLHYCHQSEVVFHAANL